jgi:hypothetical protein
MRADVLPWRGVEADRPDLPLPPGRMPLRRAGQTRKRWRYVGVFDRELMLCAARAQVGPLSQSFWILWDRIGHRRLAQTSFAPWSRQVAMNGPRVAIHSPEARVEVLLADATPVESICPSGEAWAWTRKRAGVPVSGTIETAAGRRRVEALAVDDESAGYHARRTSWHWSTGVGRATDGRALAWNLVEGINDPSRNSERVIWIDGDPFEPKPVHFRQMTEVDFTKGETLHFSEECERVRDDNFLVLRSRYRHLFGTFSGSLDGVGLAEGFGVMEDHDALW